jgi:flavin reductase (DIM6/NTAB) family NADH-FMN oxidoreductase RutF
MEQFKPLSMTQPVTGREIAALLHPRPVVLVTTCSAEGRPNVISVAWCTPLSHQPPLVGLSIGLGSYSHQLIVENGEFVINVVDSRLQKAVEICGNISGRNCDKLEMAGLETRPAKFIRPPRLAGALACLECQVERYLPAGDHTFFLAKILIAEVQEGYFAAGWDACWAQVLLCLQRDRFGRYIEVEEIY